MPPLIEGDAPSATIADQAVATASFPGTLAPMARAGASGCASIPQMSFLMGARMDAGSTITSPFEKLIQWNWGHGHSRLNTAVSFRCSGAQAGQYLLAARSMLVSTHTGLGAVMGVTCLCVSTAGTLAGGGKILDVVCQDGTPSL